MTKFRTWDEIRAGTRARVAALAPPPASDLKLSLAVLRTPCPHRGPKLPGGGCGVALHRCAHFGDVTSAAGPCVDAQRQCWTCGEHPALRQTQMSNFQEAAAVREPDVLDISTPPSPLKGEGIVIDHGAGGIGDGLLGLLAVARLSADNPGAHVEYRVSATAQPFVALFDGYSELGRHARPHSELPVPGARQLNVGYKLENTAKYPVPRWERYAANIGASGVKLPSLREPGRIRPLAGYLAGRVVLCPFSTDPAREWSVQHWLTLEALLLRRGYGTAVLHKDPSALRPFAGEKVSGESADRVASILLSAKCTIGTDSGLSHLAGILGAPTVVLGGSTPVDRIFGAYRRVTCLQGGLVCSGCCGGTGVSVGGAWTDRCKTSCGNLQSITPERVLAEVDRIWLKETLTCDASGCRTLLTPDRLATLRDECLRTNHLPGDVAELGCFRGGSAKVLRHYATGTLRLFDTFAGIPEDDSEPGGIHVRGEFAGSLESVRAFVGADRVEYHAGWFPEDDDLPPAWTRFRLVHLDADTYQSTAAALAYFAPRMTPGGCIVLDDYGFVNCPGVARAVREAGLIAERSAEYQAVVRF